MQIHVLASGSTGNSILLQAGEVNVLIDAGISTRAITGGLAGLGLTPADLAAVLITHEHNDHVKGLEVLLKKYKIPVVTRHNTWQNLYCRESIPEECRYILERPLRIGPLKVRFFKVSHDAADPVGYIFLYQEKKAVVMTDLGQVNQYLLQHAAHADAIVMESNFDPQMLRYGPYPPYLKKRIAGPRGHLSNQDAGEFLSRVAKKSHLQIILAHLSQNNNTRELAEKTVTDMLSIKGHDDNTAISLFPAYPTQTVSIKVP